MIQSTDDFQSPTHFTPRKAGPLKKAHAVRLPGPKAPLHVRGQAAIRQEFVELGRRLVADPGYPAEQVVRELAVLLSEKFEEDGV